MILNTRPLLAILLLLTSCSSNVSKTKGNDSAINQINKPASSSIDTTYMATGFYFVADSSEGVKMRIRGSNEVYTIAPDAFASVKNIIKTKLERTQTEKGVYTDLCMTFDSKGTNDLKEGTGKLLHPKMAVVVANQLLYVVDNNANITAGVVYVTLLGFSDSEMKVLQNEVDHKK
jgi:hypothetical protein